jgi:DNA mismatch endonuclease (patch repair protein)
MEHLVSPAATNAHVRAVMRGNRSRNTAPELKVRRVLWSMGYRYRLHRRDLPGTPDIVFMRMKKAIFVHGCFWHQHAQCILRRAMKSNLGYWSEKLARNAARDTRNRRLLRHHGWAILVVWECELRNVETLERKMRAFLHRVHSSHAQGMPGGGRP